MLLRAVNNKQLKDTHVDDESYVRLVRVAFVDVLTYKGLRPKLTGNITNTYCAPASVSF